MDRLSHIVKHLEGTPHDHDQKAHGRKGGGETKSLVKGLASILSDPWDGASVFVGKPPPINGFAVIVAGDKKNITDVFPSTYSAHDLWTDDNGKQFVEPSYYATAPADADSHKVLADAERLRKKNDQQSVGVVLYGGEEPLPGAEKAHVFRVRTRDAVIELINPKREKLMAIKDFLRKTYHERPQITLVQAQVAWLS